MRRWYAGILIALLSAAAIAWLQLSPDREGQSRVLGTIGAAILGTALLLSWLVVFSPLARRIRQRTAFGAIAILVLGVTLLRVRGVTGDFLPILEWRWASRTAPPTASVVGPPPDTGIGAVPTAPAPPSAVAGTAEQGAHAPETPVVRDPDAGAVIPPEPVLTSAPLAEWPQFLGPARTGVVPAIGLATDWARTPPRVLWRHPLGPGWSGFAVVDGLAVTQEQRGDLEAVVAYDLLSGAPRWVHTDAARYATVVAGEGPRATPTIHGGRVFTMGATGLLNALDLRTGRPVWQRHAVREHEAPDPDWGRSSSPLVVDGRVIVSVGGTNGRSLVAYDAATGAAAWTGGDDRVGYASPLLASIAGRSQIVIFNAASVAGHDPATGAVLWSQPWPSQQPNVAQPLPIGRDSLLVSSGYGVGSKLLRFARDDAGGLRPEVVWESPRLKAKFTNLVVHGGFVYGLDDGVLACLDPATGDRRWRSGRYGHGQVILAGDLLLVQTEEGEIVLVRPRPDRHDELTRFPALEGKTWNPPALAGRHLLVRNDREAAVFQLATVP